MVAAGAIQILQFCYDCRRRCPDSARMFWENLTFPSHNAAIPAGGAAPNDAGRFGGSFLMRCPGWGVVMRAGGAAQIIQGCSETICG